MTYRLQAIGCSQNGNRSVALVPPTYSLQPAACSLVRVVAGALFQGSRVLIAQRPVGKPMAGWWEFPGGKMHAGETPYQALVRELHEELGVAVLAAHELVNYTYRYPERSVQLELWQVTAYSGEPRSLDQQALQWIEIDELDQVGMLEGDGPMIAVLKKLRLG